ncbi:MAG TPA: hypothetical protein VM534_02755 [Thermoanaerobaculia bacterium]|nr:hypothetical protein [Thermoanaerobaculia bacterium]
MPAHRVAVTASRLMLALTLLLVAGGLALGWTGGSKADPPASDLHAARVQLAEALWQSPADRELYRRIAELALDIPDEGRFDLWRRSHRMTRHLAPEWPTAQSGFIRAGFLHWNGLGPADRGQVKSAAGRLIEQPEHFAQYWQAIWQATQDIDLFRRHAPGDADTHLILATLALRRGEFDEYRSLRNELPRRRANDLRSSPPPGQVLDHLRKIRRIPSLHPLMKSDLAYLERNPPPARGLNPTDVADFLTYALEQALEPLGGFTEISFSEEALEPKLRARLAVALRKPSLADRIEKFGVAEGIEQWWEYRAERAISEIAQDNLLAAKAQISRVRAENQNQPSVLLARLLLAEAEEKQEDAARIEAEIENLAGIDGADSRWSDLCGREICRQTTGTTLFLAHPATLALPLRVIETDSIAPWVEIALDGKLVREGAIEGSRTFIMSIDARGLHRIEVRLMNPQGAEWRTRRRVALDPISFSGAAQELRNPAHQTAQIENR